MRCKIAPARPPRTAGDKEIRFRYTLRPRNRTVERIPALKFYYLNPAAAASMGTAGMLSVLIFPEGALAILGRERRVPVEPGSGL